jgi:hypothetical protein
MKLELLRTVSFWMLILGLALEVAVAIVAFVITHKEISRKSEKRLKHWLEACAVLAGLLVLLAIIGEHIVGKLDAKEREAANARIDELEKAHKSAKNDLAKLEAKMRPKPPEERLLKIFDEINPNIVPSLKAGHPVNFSGFVKQSQKEALDKLCAEPEASKYIKLLPHEPSIGISEADGPTAFVNFSIGTNIIKSP